MAVLDQSFDKWFRMKKAERAKAEENKAKQKTPDPFAAAPLMREGYAFDFDPAEYDRPHVGIAPMPEDSYLMRREKEQAFAMQKALREKRELERKLEQDRLESGAYAPTLSTAVNLWTLRFGDGWVSEATVASANESGGMDWIELFGRLDRAGHMETFKSGAIILHVRVKT